MNLGDFKNQYGDEYPAAVVVRGIRMPLERESRFWRSYHSDEHKTGYGISRFTDGSASITASELRQEWGSWTGDMRVDFCQSCCYLEEQSHLPEILRFIMQHGEAEHWSGIALMVASELPQEEAFDTLVRALHGTELGQAANIAQAIARTRHRDAETTLRGHLAALWEHPELWNDSDSIDWVGFDAITCIAHLIELGAPCSDFYEQVLGLSEHACVENRQSCHFFLSEHYPWLKEKK